MLRNVGSRHLSNQEKSSVKLKKSKLKICKFELNLNFFSKNGVTSTIYDVTLFFILTVATFGDVHVLTTDKPVHSCI